MEDNDNEQPEPHVLWSSPDPHGQAAMLLVESLLHGLIGKSIISVADAVEIVDAASEVKEQIAADLGDTPRAKMKSLSLLDAISISLRSDMSSN